MIPETLDDLLNKLKNDWKFQNKGVYPTNKKPTYIYIQLYGSLPTSSKLRDLLKHADKEFFSNKTPGNKFKVDIKTVKENICWELSATPANVISVVASRLSKRYNEAISLVRYKINNREYEVNITKIH